MVHLVDLTPTALGWLADETAAEWSGLTKPPGGVETPEVLQIIRPMVESLWAAGTSGAWMIVHDSEVVGLCSYVAPPQGREVEIGYGVAATRRQRGHATAAVRLMLAAAARDPALDRLVAKTAITNTASERALTANGFVRTGGEDHPEDGPLNLWVIPLAPPDPSGHG